VSERSFLRTGVDSRAIHYVVYRPPRLVHDRHESDAQSIERDSHGGQTVVLKKSRGRSQSAIILPLVVRFNLCHIVELTKHERSNRKSMFGDRRDPDDVRQQNEKQDERHGWPHEAGASSLGTRGVSFATGRVLFGRVL